MDFLLGFIFFAFIAWIVFMIVNSIVGEQRRKGQLKKAFSEFRAKGFVPLPQKLPARFSKLKEIDKLGANYLCNTPCFLMVNETTKEWAVIYFKFRPLLGIGGADYVTSKTYRSEDLIGYGIDDESGTFFMESIAKTAIKTYAGTVGAIVGGSVALGVAIPTGSLIPGAWAGLGAVTAGIDTKRATENALQRLAGSGGNCASLKLILKVNDISEPEIVINYVKHTKITAQKRKSKGPVDYLSGAKDGPGSYTRQLSILLKTCAILDVMINNS